MSARRGVAPCGHPGTYVIGQFVACDEACDGDTEGVPIAIEDCFTRPFCAHCGSDDVEVYPGMMANGRDLWHCNECSRSFQT